ncbi:MAG: hypothetical protein R2706_03055 [Acidimicrobiales bacterium]
MKTWVDGIVAAEQDFPASPIPTRLFSAARLLDIPYADCIVIEDAEAGVRRAAGRWRRRRWRRSRR